MRKPASAAALPLDSHLADKWSPSQLKLLTWMRCGFVRRSLAIFCVLSLGISILLWLSTNSSSSCPPAGTPSDPWPERGDLQPLWLPRIVHFTSHSEVLRSEYRPLMQRWMDANPDFRFYLWRDVDAVCLARLRYPRWLPALNGSGQWLHTPLERSDLTRILALHSLGGLYLDLDTEPVADIGHLFDQPLAGAMFATEPPEHATLLFGLEFLISNAVMFSAPRHPFLAAYLDTIEATVKAAPISQKRNNLNAPETTGPLVMQRAYVAYRGNEEVVCSSPYCRVHLFRPEVFSPTHDLGQTWHLKSVCNATTLAALPTGKRNICVQLWARNFTQAKATYATLGTHQFSHLSSFPGANPKPIFNATAVFPRLQVFSAGQRGC